MSYQGVLTDGAGSFVPDGDYDLTFRIYDVKVGGVALWSENHPAVAVQKGGFSVILGSAGTPIGLAFDDSYYLGVTIAAGPELTPRVELASSPYSLSLRLPFASSLDSSSPGLSVSNVGTGPAIAGGGRIESGTATQSGEFRMNCAGVGTPFVRNWIWSPAFGGAVTGYSESGSPIFRLEPDALGEGGYLTVPGSSGAFTVDGAAGAIGAGPQIYIEGPTSTSIFNTNSANNTSVLLPNNAIGAAEVLDEPGIAQGKVSGTINVPNIATMTDIVTTTITIPAAGYIVVEASGGHLVGGNGSGSNYAQLQIDETAGGDVDAAHNQLSGFTSAMPSGLILLSIDVRRTYFKSAGTYTFRLEAYALNGGGLGNSIQNPVITATYFPTSYGAVSTITGSDDAVNFQEARPVTVQESVAGSPQAHATGSSYVVDLRELEVRVAREEARLAEAERQLARARAREQAEHGEAVRKER